MADISKNFKLISAIKLKEDHSIADALKCISTRKWMIVTIVDDEGCLLGVLSPGDLRKAILNGQSLDAPLGKLMNRNPICVHQKELKNVNHIHHIVEMIRARCGQVSLLYTMVPVLDDNNKLMGLINIDSLTSLITEENIHFEGGTVLIVGGAGYIGSTLARCLLEQGWSVKVLDKLLYSDQSVRDIQSDKFTLIKGDATVIDDIVRSLEGVDAVVYLAELVGDPACSLAPQTALKTNYLSVNSMAHLCSHLNINRFIYTSSCSVYGASVNPEDFLTEDSPLQPVSLYARMKALVEQSILSVCNLPNPEFSPTILRLATVFGKSYRPRFDLVVNTFVKNAIQNGEIQVFGGNQWRPNVHVTDVAGAIMRVLDAPLEDVRAQSFNVGSNENNHTINELADLAKEIFPDLRITKQDNAVDQRNYRVDFSKIEKVLNYKAQVGVKEGMLELKNQFIHEDGMDWDNPIYSNAASLKELNYL